MQVRYNTMAVYIRILYDHSNIMLVLFGSTADIIRIQKRRLYCAGIIILYFLVSKYSLIHIVFVREKLAGRMRKMQINYFLQLKRFFFTMEFGAISSRLAGVVEIRMCHQYVRCLKYDVVVTRVEQFLLYTVEKIGSKSVKLGEKE